MITDVMGRIPSQYFIYTILAGATLAVLSPIQLCLSSLIAGVFVVESASGSIFVLLILSLIAGTPLLILREPFCGGSGLNTRIAAEIARHKKLLFRKSFQKKASTDPREPLVKPNLSSFVRWTKATGLDKYIELLNIEYFVLSAFIVACEVCVILNALWLISLGFGWLISFTIGWETGAMFFSQGLSNWQLVLINTVCAICIGGLSYVCDKFYFRGYRKKMLDEIWGSFNQAIINKKGQINATSNQ